LEREPCPVCGSRERIKIEVEGFERCRRCGHPFK
jgi:ribosomal protein L37AE/L43A